MPNLRRTFWLTNQWNCGDGVSTPSIFSVAALTLKIKQLLEQDAKLRQVLVRGEISNFKHHSSGHMYFTLKDQSSRLKCVMFRSRTGRLQFSPEDGMTVIADGSVSVYERNGEYQLYVDNLQPEGQGALHLAFEQLKNKLRDEGLFDPQRKRPIPFLPRRVGIVTSPTGAAVRDILSVLDRRFPDVPVLIAPAVVQGSDGPASVVRALARLNARSDLDVVIVARGGGSLEELWTFNDEQVARAVAQSRLPVISGVGHETDFTIVDFVADYRAPTPSAAAEIAVPEKSALQESIGTLQSRAQAALGGIVRVRTDRLESLLVRPAFTRPLDKAVQWQQRVDELVSMAQRAAQRSLDSREERFRGIVGKMESLSPLATLARGYAICRTAKTSEVVKDAAQVRPGTALRVRLHKGELACRVEASE